MNKKRRKPDDEHEIARLVTVLKGIPVELLEVLSASQIIRTYNIDLHSITVWKIKADFQKQEGNMTRKEKGETVHQNLDTKMPLVKEGVERIGNQITLERIARIITKTYPHLGDNEKVGTEDALQMIYRELRQYDSSLLTRNEKRVLPKQTP